MAQFTTIDHEVRRKFNLTLNEYAICDSIYYLSRKGFCDASKNYLGEFIGISKQAVHSILNKLEQKELISRPHKQYIITTEKWDNEILKLHCDSKESLPDSKESLTLTVKKVDSDSKESLHNIYNNNNNNNIYNISFERFWKLYDKKRNRPKCESLWKKIKPELHDIIYKHIEQYKKFQPDKLYRKDPERYLKYECWNDEIIPKEEKQSQPKQQEKTKFTAEKGFYNV